MDLTLPGVMFKIFISPHGTGIDQYAGTPHFIALCFVVLRRFLIFKILFMYLVFLQIEGLWQPCIKQVYLSLLVS